MWLPIPVLFNPLIIYILYHFFLPEGLPLISFTVWVCTSLVTPVSGLYSLYISKNAFWPLVFKDVFTEHRSHD